MGCTIERLRLDIKRQYESFANQWKPGEVRVIVVAGEDAGWLQTTPADDDIFFLASFIWKNRSKDKVSAATSCSF
jgi:hypothetical protein